MMPTLKISSANDGNRLDVVLARAYPDYSRAFLQKWVKVGRVTLKGAVPAPSYRVRVGEIFEVTDFNESQRFPNIVAPAAVSPARLTCGEPGLHLPGRRIPEILFEDDALLVIDKPAGLVVHPAPGHQGPTLIDWLKGHLGGAVTKVFTDPERLGLVHRLDKDTSGVLVIAKSVLSQTAVARQFRDRTIQKTYSAFIAGAPDARKGLISAPVGRSRRQPSRMAVAGDGRPSETAFEVVEIYGKPGEVSQVTLYPKTGRTHQIRVHLAAIGHPIIGDSAYGSKSIWREAYGVTRTLLHAWRLQLRHPLTKKAVSFEAPWPDDFRAARETFKKAFAAAILACLALLPARVRAEPTAGSGTSPHKTSTKSASGSAASSAIRSMRKETAEMKDQVEAMRAEVTQLETALGQLNASGRLRDLEHSIPEINSKAVAASSAAEENKTELLELSRKVKMMQDTVDQLRDQMDRLQREVIQRRAQQEESIDPATRPRPPHGAPIDGAVPTIDNVDKGTGRRPGETAAGGNR